jgi:hypothetical protein
MVKALPVRILALVPTVWRTGHTFCTLAHFTYSTYGWRAAGGCGKYCIDILICILENIEYRIPTGCLSDVRVLKCVAKKCQDLSFPLVCMYVATQWGRDWPWWPHQCVKDQFVNLGHCGEWFFCLLQHCSRMYLWYMYIQYVPCHRIFHTYIVGAAAGDSLYFSIQYEYVTKLHK